MSFAFMLCWVVENFNLGIFGACSETWSKNFPSYVKGSSTNIGNYLLLEKTEKCKALFFHNDIKCSRYKVAGSRKIEKKQANDNTRQGKRQNLFKTNPT